MKKILLIFKKELLELRRDKRTFYSAILGPVFLIYLMMVSLSFVEGAFSDKGSQKLHVVRSKESNALLDKLRSVPEIRIIEVDSMAEGRKLVEAGKARVVLEFMKAQPGSPLQASAVFDPDEIKAKVLLGGIDAQAATLTAQKINTLLDKAGVPAPERIAAIVSKQPISKKGEDGASTLASFLPYMIVIWAFYGAFGIASEAVAAEKEKQTLETLLIAPVRRNEVAVGKFLSLFSISMVSCIVSILSIAILGPTMASKSMFGGGLHLTPVALGAMAAVILPLCAMFAGILLAVSAFSKNVRECQTFLTLISFAVLTPAVFSQFIGFTDFSRAQWVAYVPVLNTATILRQALLDKVDGQMLLGTVASSLILASVAIYLAVRMFNRERILVRI